MLLFILGRSVFLLTIYFYGLFKYGQPVEFNNKLVTVIGPIYVT